YPALQLLMEDSGSATQALVSLAIDTQHKMERRRIISCLQGFVPLVPDIMPTNAVVQAEGGEPPECGREISSLFETLSAYCFCIGDGERRRPVAACIRLSSSRLEDDKVTFGVLFMGHPHQNGQSGIGNQQLWWQDTEISLTIGDGDTTNTELDSPQEIGPDLFCEVVSQRELGPRLLYLWATKVPVPGPAICLTAERKLFVDASTADPLKQWIVERPSISLRCLLERASAQDFTEKKKEVLSVFLAKAVWQYYSSPWMREPWNKDSVHFVFERRITNPGLGMTGIFVDEPLLSVSIPAPNREHVVDNRGPSRLTFFLATNRIPKILALGIMLMEIQLGRPIESLYTDSKYSHHCPNGIAHANTNHNICKDLINIHNIYAEKETSLPMSTLITSCILPNDVFMPPHAKGLDDDHIRDALYVLVKQLEVWNSKRQPHNVQPLILPVPGMLSTNPPTPPPVSIDPQHNTQLSQPEEEMRHGRTMAQITNSKTTEDWFNRMRSVIHILKAPSDEKEYVAVKVAVLDTGVSPQHAEADYITEYQDFVSRRNDLKCDKTGHGTTSIRLILDMCESASVYVLRIFDRDVATEETQQLAVEALSWCMKNNMDIVCMACGFLSESQALRQKIREVSNRMLVIAAPTNYGNRQDLFYPARYYDFVLPMFATDGNVKSSGQNPSHPGLGKWSFAILGEDIRNIHGVVGSGTSYATAIAAGFAARLLDFARHGDSRSALGGGGGGDPDVAEKLKDKFTMTRVLLSLTMRTIDRPYYCIRPWDLLPAHLQRQIPFSLANPPSDADVRSARRDVCQWIEWGVEGRWTSG
ncbi:hypothetical protein C8A00DRAFT_17366, partial [Chaetomidium leptoderma]